MWTATSICSRTSIPSNSKLLSASRFGVESNTDGRCHARAAIGVKNCLSRFTLHGWSCRPLRLPPQCSAMRHQFRQADFEATFDPSFVGPGSTEDDLGSRRSVNMGLPNSDAGNPSGSESDGRWKNRWSGFTALVELALENVERHDDVRSPQVFYRCSLRANRDGPLGIISAPRGGAWRPLFEHSSRSNAIIPAVQQVQVGPAEWPPTVCRIPNYARLCRSKPHSRDSAVGSVRGMQ